ncbi:hypothetical protein GQ53DRAFT_751451 [Thozetella sp. PMI_491]|nr:hypothetical protein GQ53DRAFT_751451 [Thozetella sp. PMI_491]
MPVSLSLFCPPRPWRPWMRLQGMTTTFCFFCLPSPATAGLEIGMQLRRGQPAFLVWWMSCSLGLCGSITSTFPVEARSTTVSVFLPLSLTAPAEEGP